MGYLDRLNDKQREAALYTDGPLLILAGAGSGKTATMTCRIAHLIEEGVSPYNILAVTFTNKAAREMRERVQALLDEIYGAGAPDVANLWIQTFHSACLRILRFHADRLGYGKDFVVYDPQDQKTVVKNILKELNIDQKRFTPSYFLSIISDAKNSGRDPESFAMSTGSGPREEMAYEVYKAYAATLRKNNAMDFDDLLCLTVKLFENEPDVLEQYRKRFRFVMVDEYQDTNHIQYRFIKLLTAESKSICVVGDDDQCIYKWRGADIRNILDFERDFPGAKVVKLEQNYRSYGNILDAAHAVVENNKGRTKKKLWTSRTGGDQITYRRLESERDEARYIGDQIRFAEGKVLYVGDDEETNGGRPLRYSDFAILYRTNVQSRVFEDIFTREGIPYRVLGGLRYYDRKEIKDMMAYMRLVQNTADDLSLERVINEPKRGIGEKTIDKIRALALVRGESMLDCLSDEEIVKSLPGKAEDAVRAFTTVIKDISLENENGNLKVSDIYDLLLARTGYYAFYENQDTVEAQSRIENLLEFKSVIIDYEKEDPELTLETFMEKVALMADVDNHDPDENAVVLMTLHSAKGLEFPVVFMPGMEEGLFPGQRAYDTSDGLEEERRLCYVGMTRAMYRLYLTSAEIRTMYGHTDYTMESVFLRELSIADENRRSDSRLLKGDGILKPRKAQERGIGTDGYMKEEPFKPFDGFAYAKQEVKKASGSGKTFEPGDRVSHSKFGEGMVIEADDKTVTVMFDSEGRKKLAKDYAPLTKL